MQQKKAKNLSLIAKTASGEYSFKSMFWIGMVTPGILAQVIVMLVFVTPALIETMANHPVNSLGFLAFVPPFGAQALYLMAILSAVAEMTESIFSLAAIGVTLVTLATISVSCVGMWVKAGKSPSGMRKFLNRSAAVCGALFCAFILPSLMNFMAMSWAYHRLAA